MVSIVLLWAHTYAETPWEREQWHPLSVHERICRVCSFVFLSIMTHTHRSCPVCTALEPILLWLLPAFLLLQIEGDCWKSMVSSHLKDTCRNLHSLLGPSCWCCGDTKSALVLWRLSSSLCVLWQTAWHSEQQYLIDPCIRIENERPRAGHQRSCGWERKHTVGLMEWLLVEAIDSIRELIESYQ